MPIALTDPIVSALIDEFSEAVDALVGSTDLTEAEITMAIRELCELSREAKFSLSASVLPVAEQAKKMDASFTSATTRIRALWAGRDIPEDVNQYLRNIDDRTKR